MSGGATSAPIYLSEVADVDIVPREQDGFTLRNGYPAYYITVQREFDANTVSILDGVNEAIVELNAGPLGEAGLAIDLSFDASVHIRRAIALVRSNLGIGLLLAVGVLYFLMRSRRATFLVTATIPLSLLVAFVALRMFDKSLNVISLAGLAFAVGLVMDAAIVTLENIVRCRQSGMPLAEAVHKGTRQIAGALFASTVTSVAIFAPVLFMKGMEGQLFQDLALTIAVAVLASFIIAVTVLPVAASLYAEGRGRRSLRALVDAHHGPGHAPDAHAGSLSHLDRRDPGRIDTGGRFADAEGEPFARRRPPTR